MDQVKISRCAYYDSEGYGHILERVEQPKAPWWSFLTRYLPWFVLMMAMPASAAQSIRPSDAALQDQVVRLVRTGIAATTGYILVDLSDTSGFKHTNTGRVDITRFALQVDRDSSTTVTGSVKLGVVASTASGSAFVIYLDGLHFERGSGSRLTLEANYPTALRAGVKSGQSLYTVTSDSETANAYFRAVAIASPRGDGTVTPQPGDVVLYSSRTAGTFDIMATLHYRTSALP